MFLVLGFLCWCNFILPETRCNEQPWSFGHWFPWFISCFFWSPEWAETMVVAAAWRLPRARRWYLSSTTPWEELPSTWRVARRKRGGFGRLKSLFIKDAHWKNHPERNCDLMWFLYIIRWVHLHLVCIPLFLDCAVQRGWVFVWPAVLSPPCSIWCVIEVSKRHISCLPI